MAAISPILAQSEEPQTPPPHDASKADTEYREVAGRKDWGKGGKTDLFAAFVLAEQLSVLETRLGIRADQLNAWRDYTAALQDLLSVSPDREPSEDPAAAQDDAGRQKDPFDREQKLADRITARAVTAARLKDAIATLRTALTRQQVQELVAADREGWLHIPRDAFGKTDLGEDHPD